MVMTCLPTYHPGNFLMKNVKSPNSGLMRSCCILYNFNLGLLFPAEKVYS